MSKNLKKLITKFFVIAFLIIFTIGVVCYVLLKRSLPDLEGQLTFKELQEKVEITYDDMGIPQIWGLNERDGYFAFGYLHAADRMFQMDITRRIATGRISELLADVTLNIDKQQRAIGHLRLARKFISGLSERDRVRLDAYTAGINAYRRECRSYPFEYQILGIDFEEWTSIESLAILSFQTWFSNALMSPDAFLVQTFDALGEKRAASIKAPYPNWAPKTVPQQPQNLLQQALFQDLFGNNQLPYKMSHSSNSWVVSPQRSISGNAMLASDPHLDISRLPQFWYYLGLHIKENNLNAAGITTPGLPFIAMGHNGRIAWAFTVGGIDVNEYYIEKINPLDSTQYLTPDGWQNFEILQEHLNYRGSDEPVPLEIRISRHGPIMFSEDSLKQSYALHWAGYDIDLAGALSAAFKLAKVDTFPEFQSTVTEFGALDVNWTYADINGNIGYQLGTPVPIRPLETNNLPVPGWIDDYHWQGFQPLPKTPHNFNPQQGWLATCNNKPDEANLDYKLEGKFAADRILRISELLSTDKELSTEDMQRFQMDQTDAFLLHWKSHVISALEMIEETKLAKKIDQWQGYAGQNSQETALITLFIDQLKKDIFLDEFNEEKHLLWINREDLLALLEKQESRWYDNCDTPDRIETRHEIIKSAITTAIERFDDRTWGDMQSLTMAHPFSVIPILSQILNLENGPHPWGGTMGTLNASFYFPDPKKEGHFVTTVGPSWRFVIDFADVNSATIVLPAGNSGNPLSPHYMDFYELWKNGQRWNVPIVYSKVKQRTASVLELIPGE